MPIPPQEASEEIPFDKDEFINDSVEKLNSIKHDRDRWLDMIEEQQMLYDAKENPVDQRPWETAANYADTTTKTQTKVMYSRL
jgi:hypothetical protein